MLSLAAFRYRNVLTEHGGPIERIETADFPVNGRRMVQANAMLKEGLVPRRPLEIYSAVDGTGTHPSAMVARHIAVSEALERWAFHATVRSEHRARYGFDKDESSSGMAAFPGLSTAGARASARYEAYERYCLLHWWEGLLDGDWRETPWEGISAIVFEPEPDVTAVILFTKSRLGCSHYYGHAAGPSFREACRKALLELTRHEWVLNRWSASAIGRPPSNWMEQRAWFFSTQAGHAKFLERLSRRAKPTPRRELIADLEVEGPWRRFATVWRFAFRPPSERFATSDSQYFYW